MALSQADCQTLLAEMKASYFKALQGKTKTMVKYRDRTITYGAVTETNLRLLKNEIDTLEKQCGCKKKSRRGPMGIRYGC